MSSEQSIMDTGGRYVRPYLYIPELRKFFGYERNGVTIAVSRQTIERHFKRGLKKSWMGGKVIVWREDLETYMATLRNSNNGKNS
jgi:hypothetical protein